MTTTRNVTNAGAPLAAPDGTKLAGVRISFTLVDDKRRAIDVWDATTGERIAGKVEVTTDDNAEFTAALWPNSRGNKASKYLCEVDADNVADVLAIVPAGSGDLTWAEFLVSSAPMTPQDLNALEQHEASTTAHAASSITVTPAGSIAATNVQAALVELDAEKQPVDLDLTAIAGLTPANDDILQRKAGAWTNRTMTQFAADLVLTGLATGSATALASTDTYLEAFQKHEAVLATKADLADADFTVLKLGGITVVTVSGAQTLTNKTISGASNTLSNIADTSLLTISTAGKVSNSATTATSANTASAIVARDGSGNFSAGTITADLTGLASNASALQGSTWAAPSAIGSGTPAAGTFTTLQATGDLTVDGNLIVSGTTTTIDTANLAVEDPLIKLSRTNTTDALDVGFYGVYQPAATPLYTGMFRDATDGKYKLFYGLEAEPTTTVNTAGTGYTAATLVADVEGNVTGTVLTAAQGNITSLGTLTGLTVSGSTSLQALSATTGAFSGQVLLSYANPDVAAVHINATTGTNAAAQKYTNGSGNFFVGIDNSDGARITGTAYARAVWSEANYPIVFGVNNAQVATLSSSTFAITPAVTMANTLSVGLASNPSGATIYAHAAADQNIEVLSPGLSVTGIRLFARSDGGSATPIELQGSAIKLVDGSGNLRLLADANGAAITGTLSATGLMTLSPGGASSAEISLVSGDGRTYNIASTGSGYGSAGKLIFYDVTGGAERMAIKTNTINISNLPTSSAGLSTGDLWNNAGTLCVA